MKTDFLPLNSILSDWMDISQNPGEVDELRILKFANDAVERISSETMLSEKIALLEVNNYKVELPRGFHSVIQAAGVVDKEDYTTREQVTEWVQKVAGEDCTLDIKLNCKKCGGSECSCSRPFITVDVNRIYEDAHPELYARHAKHFYGYGGTTGRPCSQYAPKLKLLRYSSNSFFSIPHHIPGCANINLDTEYEYKIDYPYIITNFNKGQILLSYYSKRVDDDGYLMIPDHPIAVAAVLAYIMEREALVQYNLKGDQMSRAKWGDMRQEKEMMIARAKNQLKMPEADSHWQFLNNHWRKMTPYYNWEKNFNARARDSYSPPEW